MKFVARFCLALPLLTALVARPLAAQQRPITQDDLYHFKWVADPRISPDGRQVAYVLVTVNAKRPLYVSTQQSSAFAQGVSAHLVTAQQFGEKLNLIVDGRNALDPAFGPGEVEQLRAMVAEDTDAPAEVEG